MIDRVHQTCQMPPCQQDIEKLWSISHNLARWSQRCGDKLPYKAYGDKES